MKRSFSDAHDDRGRKRTAKPGDAGDNGVKRREGKVVQPDDEVVKGRSRQRRVEWSTPGQIEILAYAVKFIVQGRPDDGSSCGD